MKRLDNIIVRFVRERGTAATWDVAAAGALTPYIIGVCAVWPGIGYAMPAYVSAFSLAVTLLCLATLRTALSVAHGDPSFLINVHKAQVTKTIQTTRSSSASTPDRDPVTGLPTRDILRTCIDTHDSDTAPSSLGLIRFANHASMAAFDPLAAKRVMAEFARRLERAAGRQRVLAQIDEDSFAMWFAGAATSTSASEELWSIAYVMAQEIDDAALRVSPDIHLSCARAHADDTLPGLLGRTQATLVPIKRYRRAGQGAHPVLPVESPADQFALEQALRQAVGKGQLSLRYQPFVDVAEGCVVGAEVLLRWRHPVLGDISPARFVPILEATGLVHDIGLWTLNTACRQLSQWRGGGSPDLRLAVNLSAIQLQSPNLKAVIERTVASHGLAPSDIELELTETAALEDHAQTAALFQDLRNLGCGIALDDFGNGHSNLSYLKSLPFTKLKIDREFVADIDTQPGNQAICKALVELGAGLGISVLAEGVERFEEVHTLRRLGCNVFQGFYFAKPLTAEELTSKLIDPEWHCLIKSDVHRGRAELQKRMVS